jgi:broad specificity phosphatase PhoE
LPRLVHNSGTVSVGEADLRIILVRHGQTQWNLEGRSQGHADSPLTALGVEQARLVSREVCQYRVDDFYCSDLGRTAQTAQVMVETCRMLPQAKPDTRLREIDLGAWEGWTEDEIKRKNPKEYDDYTRRPERFRSPQGESFDDVRDRIRGFLSEVCGRQARAVLIVGHSGSLRIAVLELLGRPNCDLRAFGPVGPAAIAAMVKTEGIWQFERPWSMGHPGRLSGRE